MLPVDGTKTAWKVPFVLEVFRPPQHVIGGPLRKFPLQLSRNCCANVVEDDSEMLLADPISGSNMALQISRSKKSNKGILNHNIKIQ